MGRETLLRRRTCLAVSDMVNNVSDSEPNQGILPDQPHGLLQEYATAPIMSEIHPDQPRISTTRFISPTMFL